MIWLICSESFRSISAMMAEIVLVASDEIKVEELSACSASVRTAAWTADCFSGSRALNSLFNRASNSFISAGAAEAPAACAAFSGGNIKVSSGLKLIRRWRSGRRRCGCQRFHQFRVAQYFRDQLFSLVLAIHVGQQVGQLRPRLQQLIERPDFARHRGRGKILHALEGHLDIEVVLSGQSIGNLKGDPGLAGLEALVKVVNI